MLTAFADDPRFIRISKNDFIGKELTDIAALVKITKSKSNIVLLIYLGAARKLRESGGLYLNKKQIKVEHHASMNDLLHESFCLLRTGKENYKVIHVY